MVERNLSRVALVLIGTALVVSAAACGSSGSGSGSGSSASNTAIDAAGLSQAKSIVASLEKTPTTIPQTVPLPKAPPKGIRFADLVQENVAPQAIMAADMKAAVDALGWNFEEISYDPAAPATLQQALNTALAKHAQVVTMTSQSPSLFGSSIIAAYQKAGVPIIVQAVAPAPARSANSPVIGDPAGPATYAKEASAVAAWFVADSGGEGKAILDSVPGFDIEVGWQAAFTGEVKKLCPTACSVKVVDSTIATSLNATANATYLTAQLQRNPSYKYLIYDDGVFASGITAALQSAGLSGIKIAGADFDAEQAAALRSGTELAWTGQGVLGIADGVVDYAARYIEHVPLTSGNDQLETQILTQSTIGNQTMFNEPANSLQQYEKLWQVPATSD